MPILTKADRGGGEPPHGQVWFARGSFPQRGGWKGERQRPVRTGDARGVAGLAETPVAGGCCLTIARTRARETATAEVARSSVRPGLHDTQLEVTGVCILEYRRIRFKRMVCQSYREGANRAAPRLSIDPRNSIWDDRSVSLMCTYLNIFVSIWAFRSHVPRLLHSTRDALSRLDADVLTRKRREVACAVSPSVQPNSRVATVSTNSPYSLASTARRRLRDCYIRATPAAEPDRALFLLLRTQPLFPPLCAPLVICL